MVQNTLSVSGKKESEDKLLFPLHFNSGTFRSIVKRGEERFREKEETA